MLLSLQAGGVGLNLIGGNHLYLLDMHWNPALESQVKHVTTIKEMKSIFTQNCMDLNPIKFKS